MIIAVDFDGTLSLNAKYPNIGLPNTKLFNSIKESQLQGDTIILWTCREGKELDEAVKWCNEQGLYFDYVNENVPWLGFDSRKIVADIYIDDCAYNPKALYLQQEYTPEERKTYKKMLKRNSKSVGVNVSDL